MVKLACLFSFLCLSIQANAQRSDFADIDFKKADSMAIACKSIGLQNTKTLVTKLTAGLNTDVERFRAIYTWICNNISNDYGMYLKNMRKRRRFIDDSLKLENWNSRFRNEVFRTLIKKKRTICTGYAYLLQQLAKEASIECEMVHGFGKTSSTDIDRLEAPNHSWNAVLLEGKWYLCDPTWSSGLINPETYKFDFLYNEGYFLTSPELFAINHFPIDSQWMLLDPAPSYTEFLEFPILYGEAFNTLKSIKTPLKLNNEVKKQDLVSFEYALLQPISEAQISLMLSYGDSNRNVKPTRIEIENDLLIIEYQFESSGYYDLHLMFEKEYIASYSFRVRS